MRSKRQYKSVITVT